MSRRKAPDPSDDDAWDEVTLREHDFQGVNLRIGKAQLDGWATRFPFVGRRVDDVADEHGRPRWGLRPAVLIEAASPSDRRLVYRAIPSRAESLPDGAVLLTELITAPDAKLAAGGELFVLEVTSEEQPGRLLLAEVVGGTRLAQLAIRQRAGTKPNRLDPPVEYVHGSRARGMFDDYGLTDRLIDRHYWFGRDDPLSELKTLDRTPIPEGVETVKDAFRRAIVATDAALHDVRTLIPDDAGALSALRAAIWNVQDSWLLAGNVAGHAEAAHTAAVAASRKQAAAKKKDSAQRDREQLLEAFRPVILSLNSNGTIGNRRRTKEGIATELVRLRVDEHQFKHLPPLAHSTAQKLVRAVLKANGK